MTAAEIFNNAVARCASASLNLMELLGIVEQLRSLGEVGLSADLYKIWIAQNGADPLLHAVYFNYGVTLNDLGDLDGAAEAFRTAINLNADFFPPHINLGSVYERKGQLDLAVNQWFFLVNRLAMINAENLGHKLMALKQIGRVLEVAKQDTSAEAALRQILEVEQIQRDVIQHFINLRLRQCKWPVIQPWGNVTKQVLMKGMYPLTLAAYSDDPMFHLANSALHNKIDVGWPAGIVTSGRWATPVQRTHDRLRVGYLSSDLRNHAVGHLICEALEYHDRTKVEVFVYYCGIPQDDDLKFRIRNAVEHWTSISDRSDKAAARQIVEDEIDILVDLNGYSMSARTRVCALRPAPVIVNWLGYPGTMGSPYHDYIIADEFLVPPDYEIFYSEKVARLPCYQPNDRKRIIADLPPDARRAAGLPDGAVVYCNFNGAHKFTRFTFERWMAILRAVPNSVLWLLQSFTETDQRLREQAQICGVEPHRLIFSERQLNADHLARYRLADIFLDNWPYGAHTTASDAMWMGVPVVTLPGRAFASRVCGSLVRAAGMADLLCADPEDYVAKAAALGNDPERLADCKARLAANRDHCILFDTPGLVRSLEVLYGNMWNSFQAGALPSPDLHNLDVYHEIGVEEEHEAIDFTAIKDYRAHYQSRLAYRHSLSPIPFDRRLWRDPG